MTKNLEYLDPASLVIGVNVREPTQLAPLFLASVKERGVLEPVLAHRDDTGAVVVDQGQRRTLAACQLGLATIPVVVDDSTPADADRLVDQWTENEHRTALTGAERVQAVQQLALLGLSVSAIAKKTATPKSDVEASVVVGKSATALAHVDAMTLADAALLAEFDGDTDAIKTLLQEVSWGRSLAAPVQRIRNDRAEQQLLADRAAELTAEGLTVIARPSYDEKSVDALSYLRDGKKKVDPEAHVTCPGHVVWLERQYAWQGNEKAVIVRVEAGCNGWAKHGHTNTSSSSSSAGRAPIADLPPAEQEKARKERRHIIESNKDWKASTTVRRRWLQQFLQRKTAPTGAEALVAAGVVNGWTAYLNSYNPGGDAWKILGTTWEAVDHELATATPKRALQIALAVTVGCWEASTSDDTWRTSVETSKAAAVLVLQAISQWGHEMSAIETAIVDGTAATPNS